MGAWLNQEGVSRGTKVRASGQRHQRAEPTEQKPELEGENYDERVEHLKLRLPREYSC